MTDDILGKTVDQTEEPASSAVEELVGEGRKFKDVESLATAKLESDKFIEQLKFENESMRKEIGELSEARDTSKTIEDVVKALETREQGTAPTNQVEEASVNVEDVVRNVLNQERQQATATENRNKVNQELMRYFGGDAEKAVQYKQSALDRSGLSQEDLDTLVARSPSAAMAVLGLNSQSNQPNVSISAMGAQGEAPRSGTVVRNQSYYKALKKEMGANKFYGDIKLQQQMFKDADSLGDDYFK